ncbi:fructose-specific PTS transporter subunit EIIC [Acaricomes phytoseiuli]|uniref:PTS fructose transporter subunit IIABC n=1 Tax=Acaricomes phytoseiuli TaxID=291968 RepID=UPI00037E1A3A|nr:fructose-specific PTS transporter subunit EIIC [Acaricomes phytoseiuli]MCW1250033.1 fructose-specific PTS transporter subunit EIIC [Acaricomes phytoseiuli]
MNQLITNGLISLDQPLGGDAEAVIRALADRIADQGRAQDADALFADAWAREQKTATGVPGGIAIPHCRSESVTAPTLGFARLPQGGAVDFGAKDGPADLIFFIAAPTGADQTHLKLLSALARALVRKDFTAKLRAAQRPEEIVALVEEAISPTAENGQSTATPTAPQTPETPTETAQGGGAGRLVAVTACPTGIAHTYMAADSLAAAAQEAGVELHVETQGSSGTKALDPAVIAAADAVIFAVDVDVRDKARFAGKPVVSGPVKRGIDEPAEMIRLALQAAKDPQATRVTTDSGASSSDGAAAAGQQEHLGQKLKRVLLTGVSYMIPFVAAGGLLIALGFLLGSANITSVADDVVLQNNLWNLPEALPDTMGPLATYLGAVFFKIGALSMGFLVPALAGYIAYGIADRPGIAPGFTAGAVAAFMGAGFLGGLAGGLLAGVVAWWLGNFNLPRWLRGLMPVVIIPLVASIAASGLMFLVLGGPIAALTTGLNDWLSGMTGTSAILLGVILGLMMCFDLGGPVNKVAYSFAVAGLGAGAAAGQGPALIMATVMAAGMVPPLGMALATFIDRKRFSVAERENGKTAVLLGFSFISEGAIPFAAADPLRVIPASMAGGAVTGALTMAWGVTSQAPHGGIFVGFAIDPFLLFLLAVLIGTVVTALLVLALKRWTVRQAPAEASADALAAENNPAAAATAAAR